MTTSQLARAVIVQPKDGSPTQYRCIVGDRLFALPFDSMASAQDFADLCNRKARTKSPERNPKTITITLQGKTRTFTPSEWTDFLAGKLQ